MKIPLDTCVWGKAKEGLIQQGHDVLWAGDWAEDPGDSEILSRAYREGRALVTLDKDFGELAIVRKIPHCGIVRLVNVSAKNQGDVCSRVLVRYGESLQKGAIITVETNRIRIRSSD